VLVKPEYSNITEFDKLPNLHKYINEDVLDTFDRMINSDILIASRSSLSACASYLKSGITIYHNFWHRMLTKDIEHNDPSLVSKIKSFVSDNLNNKITNSSENLQITSIPRRIIQVWLQGCLDDKVKNNLLRLNPDYEYLFFSENECVEYLNNNYSKIMVETFHALKNPAHKSDLFRYCYLYKEGGIYIDADLELKISCDTIINASKSSFISAVGAHSNNKFGECTNGLIFTTSYNDIFLYLIEFIVQNPNPTDYGLYVKDLFNKLNPKESYKSYNIGDLTYYLYKEVMISGKYYIVDSSNNIIINTNGHNYL
jgi:mannosyltransferase OCH1-like enzyme